MKIDSEAFRVPPGKEFKLGDRPTIVKPFYQSKKDYQALLKDHVAELSDLQQLHYASNRYALLLIFKEWTPPGKTAPSATSCPGSTRQDARFPVSNSRVRKNCLIIARILLDTLESLKMAYPKTTARRRRELRAIRKQLKKN